MTALHLRLYDALESRRGAQERGDGAAVEAHAAEIGDLLDIAARHGVDITCGYPDIVPVA